MESTSFVSKRDIGIHQVYSGDANIIIGERDVFDFTGSQPPDDIATIYRVLDVSELNEIFADS
jgi:hypothetical protein